MSDADAQLEEQADEPGSEAVADEPVVLDLSKYKSRELVQKVMDLISIQDAFGRLSIAIALAELATFIAMIALFYGSTFGYVGWFLTCAYALVAGFVYGVVIGLLRIASAALGHLEEILRLNLEIGRTAIADAANLKSGKARPPSGAELIEMVHDQVMWPIVEEVISEMLGFVGKPLLWIYRRTIASAVRYVIKLVDRLSLTNERESQVQQKAKEALFDYAKYAESTDAYLVAGLGVVEKAGKTIRSYVMRPFYIIFFICLSISVIPLLVVRYLATGEPS